MESADVVVLGLGPAGASAAAAAARPGLRVIALERRRTPGLPVQCAEFVPALVGVEPGTLAAAVRQSVDAMTTTVEDDRPEHTPEFRGCMLDRAAFDAALVAQATRAGAQCRLSSAVRRVAIDGRVELSDGRVLRARVIVGADGPRSLAGRAIGSVNARLVETRQITVPLLEPCTATDIFLSAATPGGYGWLFPKRELAHVGAGVEPAAKRRLKAIVERLHDALAARGRVGRAVLSATGGAIPVGGMLRVHGTLAASAVLLAGDAAGLANPVTGAGIAAAVDSGRLAGEAAARIVAGHPCAASDYETELAELYGAALERALSRRRELASAAPGRAALRRGWIACPEYWL
jgi:geranylgeranyl reductase family protein